MQQVDLMGITIKSLAEIEEEVSNTVTLCGADAIVLECKAGICGITFLAVLLRKVPLLDRVSI